MSKLYDQLKNAARTRKQALERKAEPAAPQAEPLPTDPPLTGKALDDSESHWREEIEDKLREADRDLAPRGRVERATLEHHELFEAWAAGDESAVEERTRRHIEEAHAELTQFVELGNHAR